MNNCSLDEITGTTFSFIYTLSEHNGQLEKKKRERENCFKDHEDLHFNFVKYI